MNDRDKIADTETPQRQDAGLPPPVNMIRPEATAEDVAKALLRRIRPFATRKRKRRGHS